MRDKWLQAVVFDLDGTLLDSESLWDEIRRDLAKQDGVPWPETATTDMMGMSTEEWSRYLADEVGLPGDAETQAKRTIDGMVRHYREVGVPEIPGATAAVRRIAEHVPVAIATSSPRVLIDTVVEELNLGDVFTTTVSTEEVAQGKPAPDGYLRACELLGKDPAQTFAVEDSGAGINSALAAGMKVAVIPARFHPPTDDLLTKCDLVLPDLSQLTFERLLACGKLVA